MFERVADRVTNGVKYLGFFKRYHSYITMAVKTFVFHIRVLYRSQGLKINKNHALK